AQQPAADPGEEQGAAPVRPQLPEARTLDLAGEDDLLDLRLAQLTQDLGRRAEPGPVHRRDFGQRSPGMALEGDDMEGPALLAAGEDAEPARPPLAADLRARRRLNHRRRCLPCKSAATRRL